MILLPLLASLLSAVWGCKRQTIPPCACREIQGNRSNIITCTGAENEETLEKSLHRIRGDRVKILYIANSSLIYLPDNAFEGVRIETLHLVDSTFQSLSNSDVALRGLEATLRTLIVQGCSFFSGWNWHHLKDLHSLDEIKTVKIGLNSIEEEIEDIAHLNVDTLQITQDSVSYIHETAFSNFKNLDVLSLKMNLVSDIRRNMLPYPAPNLRQLNFGYNKIQQLPEDIFVAMPKLKTINLAGNSILFLHEKTLSPVWKQLKKIDILENPIRCDCRMKWLLKVDLPASTWSECAEPPQLKGKELSSLGPDDLWC